MEIIQLINRSLLQKQQASLKTGASKVVSDRPLTLYPWVLTLVNQSGLELIASEYISFIKVLQNLGERQVEMVLLFADSRSGFNLISYINTKAQQIRKILPDVGILIVSNNPNDPINSNLLPVRIWIVNPNTTSEQLKIYIIECRFALRNNNFFIREILPTNVIKTLNEINTCIFKSVPNFNIKHPAMLIPIANAALKNKSPVFVEISPQEALVYYQAESKTLYGKIEKVLHQLRKDVDWVKENTGAIIYLHLDHCNDPEIIRIALELGFDSIMADGSNLTLGANIRFVNSIKSMASQFNVPVEAEVGAIDLNGFRKKSTTILSDLEKLTADANMDFIGVNIRQFHGCDYGFERSREAFLELDDLIKKKNYSAKNLVEACLYVDNILSENDFPANSNERKAIRCLIDKSIYTSETLFSELIDEILANPSITVAYWINEVKLEWHKRQIFTMETTRNLFTSILGYGVKQVDNHSDKSLDFNLLSQIEGILNNTEKRLVLHGGSSIKKEDLFHLKKYNVSRINFGSQPFKLFINSLRAAKSGKYNFSNKALSFNPIETNFFINEYASNWKQWIGGTPYYMKEFENEIDTIYFKPIIY